MLPPLLVVEVVSLGELQRDRDYVAKRNQYEKRGIPEYWLVDPETSSITILTLSNQAYHEAGYFKNSELITSLLFPTLNLTAQMILNAGE